MTGPRFLGGEIYRGSSYGAHHPLRVPRVSTVMDLSRALGWLPPDRYRISPRAKPKALELFHRRDYIDALVRAEATQQVNEADRQAYGLGTHSNPVFAEMYRRPATGAGGALLAAELLAERGVIYHPAGGTHHGHPARASGFCYLNDPALAVLALRRVGARRIAYVDIDAHHPDGVEAGLAEMTDLLMISVHEENRWPRTGRLDDTAGGRAVNLPVPAGLNDSEMTLILNSLILPLLERFAPDALVLQCGADGVEEDPLSRLSLSNNAHFDVVRAVQGIAPRLLVLGGGGYNPWSVGRLWTGVWGILGGHTLPAHLPTEAEAVLRALRFDGNSRGRNPPEHWFSTLVDAPRPGPIGDALSQRLRYLARTQGLPGP